MTRVGWLDCSSGASGDMLLGAVIDAGAPLQVVRDALAALEVAVDVSVGDTTRGGLRALQATVTAPDDPQPRRTWRDVRAILDAAALPAAVGARARSVFARLAHAEAAVHGGAADDVHFHEVGALDALADVVGVCAGLAALGLDRLHAGPVALGGGTARSEHGELPVPVPAVLELLRDTTAVTRGGPVDVELCTPTGAALLAEWVTAWGPAPAMTVDAVGTGAGGRDLPGRANALRLVVGTAAPTPPTGQASVLSCNVDDLDPRLWPEVLAQLLAAGASDAWLTPILMKKGRPAHTLSVLVPDDPSTAAAVRRVVFTTTSTIGMRGTRVDRWILDRELLTVQVDGQPVRIKVARLDGEIVGATPEFDDVVAAAAQLQRPVKAVLGAATAAAGAAGLLP